MWAWALYLCVRVSERKKLKEKESFWDVSVWMCHLGNFGWSTAASILSLFFFFFFFFLWIQLTCKERDKSLVTCSPQVPSCFYCVYLISFIVPLFDIWDVGMCETRQQKDKRVTKRIMWWHNCRMFTELSKRCFISLTHSCNIVIIHMDTLTAQES